jgi:hypothetical protein
MNKKKLQELYNTNPVLKDALDKIFTKEELKSSSNIIYNSVGKTQETFNSAFKLLCKDSTQIYIDPKTNTRSLKKTTYIEVLDNKGRWLFKYDTNKTSMCFRYQCDRVYKFLLEKLLFDDYAFHICMKNMIQAKFKLVNVIPQIEFQD